MNRATFLRECLIGGPGLNGYVYQGSHFCADCASDIAHEIPNEVVAKIESVEDCAFQDSETVPQPIFFGEADLPIRCETCDEFLYGPDDWDAVEDPEPADDDAELEPESHEDEEC